MAQNGVLYPRFFKVFLSETASESLVIPLSFMEYLDDPLPKTVKLQGIGGRFWTVNLKRKRHAVYITGGWPKFAEDHDLKDGEFLTFVYDGYQTFEVSVFGRWGFKETRAVAETIEISESESDEGDKETSMDVDDYGEDDEISKSLYPFGDEETETDAAVIEGNSNKEMITNPTFSTSLKNRIYELLIPATVVKEHNLMFGDTIKYIDEEGTLEGQRGKWADDRICFKGWDRICRRNKLRKHEDIVQCELLHNQRHVHSIRVRIVRGAALSL